MKKLLYLLFTGLGQLAAAQQAPPVQGSVRDSSGQPLAGATVQVTGTELQTTTGKDGRFTLATALEAPILRITHTGYRPLEFPIKGRREDLVIVLQPQATVLEGVVVSTGYQRLPRERATGSFAQLDETLIRRSTGTDIISRLDGIAPSVLFDRRGTADKISIRGRSTLYANDQPLVVVDNFPFDGDLRSIHPDDVESITLLKDAAAASIWGTRAANGVIVITTKKGRAGQPPQVTYHGNATWTGKPDFDRLPWMSSADFIEVEQFLFGRNFYRSQETNLNRPVLSPAVELLIRRREGTLTPEATEAALEALRGQDVRRDFKNHLYDYGLHQQHQLGVQGGGSHHTYRFSAGYDHRQDGLDATYRRYSLRTDQSFSLGSRLELQAALAYTQGRSAAGRTPYTAITAAGNKELYPYARLADEEGNPLAIYKTYRQSFVEGAPAAGLLDWQYRPLEDHRYNDNRSLVEDLQLQTGFTYRLLPGLTAEGRYQYGAGNSNDRNLQGEGSWQVRDFINRYTQVQGGSLAYAIPPGGILDMAVSRLQSHTGRGQLNYSHAWEKGRLTALAGTEIREVSRKGHYNRTYGYDRGTLSFASVNYDSAYQLYHNRNLRGTVPASSGFSDFTDRYLSFFVNAAYSYKNRYTISFSGRRDGSNLFGAATNEKMVPLWSAGLSWNLSDEAFYSLAALPRLRLRATYGLNGNRDGSTSAYTSIRHFNGEGNMILRLPYAMITRLPNPDLRWEQVAMVNLGLDFGVAGDRVSGRLELYRKEAQDLLGDAPLDPTVGWPSGTLRVNTGRLRTQGADLELHTRNLTGALQWETTLLASYNNNRLTYYDTSQSRARSFLTSGNTVVPLVGKPVQYILSYPWAGLEGTTGDPMGYLNGHESKNYLAILNNTPVADLLYHGPAVAPWFGSLRNTLSWKGWSLSALVTFRLGYYFRRPSISYSQLFNNWRGHDDYARRWQKEGDEQFTQVPSMVYPAVTNRDNFYALATPLVERGDHVRLQDLRLAYQLEGKKGGKGSLQGLECYLYARNLGRIWKRSAYDLDPDFGTSLPEPLSLSLGIRTTIQ